MDKYEYRIKLDEMNKLVEKRNYKAAVDIADSIDWRRVRNIRTLCTVSEIYEANERYEDSKEILLLAYSRSQVGRSILYRLTELAIKMKEYDDAVDYYTEFVQTSPSDNNKYILKYKIYKGRGSSLEDQIKILQDYKGREHTEKYGYELAQLYEQAGMIDKCIEECDDLILWFNEGKHVYKAMELKMKYTPLTPEQRQVYDRRGEKDEDQEVIEESLRREMEAARKEKEAMAAVEKNHHAELHENENGGWEESLADKLIAEAEKEIAQSVAEEANKPAEPEAPLPKITPMPRITPMPGATPAVGGTTLEIPVKEIKEEVSTDITKNLLKQLEENFGENSESPADRQESSVSPADAGFAPEEAVSAAPSPTGTSELPIDELSKDLAANVTESVIKKAIPENPALNEVDPYELQEKLAQSMRDILAGLRPKQSAGDTGEILERPTQNVRSLMEESSEENPSEAAAEPDKDEVSAAVVETVHEDRSEAIKTSAEEQLSKTAQKDSDEEVSVSEAAADEEEFRSGPAIRIEFEEETDEEVPHFIEIEAVEPAAERGMTPVQVQPDAEEEMVERQITGQLSIEDIMEALTPEGEYAESESQDIKEEIGTKESATETKESEIEESVTETKESEIEESATETKESVTETKEVETEESPEEAEEHKVLAADLIPEFALDDELASYTLQPEDLEALEQALQSNEEKTDTAEESEAEPVFDEAAAAAEGPAVSENPATDTVLSEETEASELVREAEASELVQEAEAVHLSRETEQPTAWQEAEEPELSRKSAADDTLVDLSAALEAQLFTPDEEKHVDNGENIVDNSETDVESWPETVENDKNDAQNQEDPDDLLRSLEEELERQISSMNKSQHEEVEEAELERELLQDVEAEVLKTEKTNSDLSEEPESVDVASWIVDEGENSVDNSSLSVEMEQAPVEEAAEAVDNFINIVDNDADDENQSANGSKDTDQKDIDQDDYLDEMESMLNSYMQEMNTKKDGHTAELDISEMLRQALESSTEDFDADGAEELSEAEGLPAEAGEAQAEELPTEGVKTDDLLADEFETEGPLAEEMSPQQPETAAEPDFDAEETEEIPSVQPEEADDTFSQLEKALESFAGVEQDVKTVPAAEASDNGYLDEEEKSLEDMIVEQSMNQHEVPVQAAAPLDDDIKIGEVRRKRANPIPEEEEDRSYIKHTLSEDEKGMFSYFSPIQGMEHQLAEALSIARHKDKNDKTSRRGNVVIMGSHGTGKTALAINVIKAIKRSQNITTIEIEKADASDLNNKNITEKIGKMTEHALLIERASHLSEKTIQEMNKAMEFKTNGLLIVLEDEKYQLRALLEEHPDFAAKFDARINIPIFTNDELVSFGKSYAKELDFRIDDLAILALYNLIGDNQTEEHPITVADVKEMVDKAIKRAERFGIRKFVKIMMNKHYDDEDRIVLYERDFF